MNNERCFLTCLYRSLSQNQEQFESFCENIIDVFSGIHNQQPTCSVLVGDFNAKLSKWCPSAKDNKAGQDIDTFIATSGYTQMIGQPTHITNYKSPCIDLLFTTNSTTLMRLITNYSVMLESSKLFIINAIIILYMDHLISRYLFLHLTIEKFGITKAQIRYVYSVKFH